MSEVESKEFELQAFRDEIKKLATHNESLSIGINGVEDLEPEEMDAWNKYKQLFVSAYSCLDECKNLEDIKENKDKFETLWTKLDELNVLVDSVRKPLHKVEGAEEKDKNRLEFLGWLNNLLVLKSNLSMLFRDYDFLEESDIDKMKNGMKIKKDSLLL